MKPSYEELLKQRAELDRQIEEARAQELDSALGQIRKLMDQYGISVQEIMPNSERTACCNTSDTPQVASSVSSGRP